MFSSPLAAADLFRIHGNAAVGYVEDLGMLRVVRTLVLASICLAQTTVFAQGLLVGDPNDKDFRLPRPIWPHPIPRPTPRPAPVSTYKIKELEVEVGLKDQVAKVQVSQSFVNTGSTQMEVSFVFPLPYDGAIEQMTFMVDGKEFPGKLLSAEEARKIYQSHVSRNKDPALLEWVGTGMFKTSVFPVPPGATRKVTLKYTQLCRKHAGLTELTFPLSTAKYTAEPVEKIKIDVDLQSQAKIKNIYSPSHQVEIKRPSDTKAEVSYTGSKEVPSTDFRLLYDVGDKPVGANLISYKPKENDEGYFLLLVTPEIKRAQKKPMAKTVVFVVDRSGSMSGKKFEQAQAALRFVLNNLKPDDLFNVIAYDSTVESFKPELQKYSEETRKEALGFVNGLHAGGSTNIDGALEAALGQLQDDKRPNYIVFLTDGLPTAGERGEAKIAANAKDRNKVRARVFSFGVGYDVNSRLLDKLSRLCYGQSHYVRPNEDIEAHVSQLYSRIEAPALKDISIAVEIDDFDSENGKLINRVYPRDAYDLFAGDQLVLAGRYKKGGDAKITIKGSIDGTKHEFHFPAKLAKNSKDQTFAFVEKLWAMRRVGEIIDEIDLQGKNDELVKELVELATRHGIVTPYTAFLADENTDVHDLAANTRASGETLEQLHEAEGVRGFVQRDIKAQFQRANNPAPQPASSYGVGGGGLGGGAAAMPGMSGGAMAGSARTAGMPLRRIDDDSTVQVTNVRQIADKTFYFRDKKWVDATITPEQEKNVQKVERFSKDYFDLLAKYGREMGKYAAVDEEVTVVIEGQAYSF